MAEGYSTVSVPTPLWERLKTLHEAYPQTGHRSASDAVTDAIRHLCDEIEDRARREGWTSATAEGDEDPDRNP